MIMIMNHNMMMKLVMMMMVTLMGLSGTSHCNVENERKMMRGKTKTSPLAKCYKSSRLFTSLDILSSFIEKETILERKEPEREYRLVALRTSKPRQPHKF